MSNSKVFLRVNRVDPATSAAARDVTVADLHECMGGLGFTGLMTDRMKPVTGGARIAGPAITAQCSPGDNLMMHRALYLAKPGDVLVVVCQSEDSAAQWGDVATRYAQQKGLAGVVIQGCARDVDAVRALNFPVWSTRIWPIHAEKAGRGVVNAPVICGGATVRPGDLVVADGDGVVVVPRDQASAIVAAAQAKMRREDDFIKAIGAGAALWDLSGAAAVYASMNIHEIDAAFDDIA